ncbi:NAD(P)/FAD-dependent oxidoreductase [Macrococcoides canis]|uniref:NAD(P)/FAD-dependent oxidoreductase n=1 Tax=Macrococcoides canis TaxID=1855823 RepID=UPI001B8CA431|nr:FAD-dependent oxidoreductase [Macrococcus canis]QUR94475.1 FAD-dependent oxidoreductase [Macrococcus canis]UTH07008.1 FAD-dependent oxidoreductase [Macrococcus canis]
MVITKFDVLIIGGGIIGQSICYHLKQEGISIGVIDDFNRCRATHAAGGMLGAQNEFYSDSPLFQLSMEGQHMMKGFADELARLGHGIDYQQHGLLKIASHGEHDALLQQYDFLNTQFKTTELVKDRLHEFAHGHIRNHDLAMWIPTDGQVNAVKYHQALMSLNEEVTFIHDRVVDVKKDNGFIVSTSTHTYEAQQIVVAAGMYSGDILKSLGIHFEIHGVKGEVMTIHHPALNMKETLFQTNGHYIVPKSDDLYVIGATTSMNGDNTVSEEGIDWLKEMTLDLLPELMNGEIVDRRCGFRPDNPLQRPVIDEVRDNLFVATGHYRNGILLSKITGALMHKLMFDKQHPLAMKYKDHFKLEDIHETILK